MFARFLLLFVLLPLIELGLLIQVGRWIGLWTTLGLVLLTGVLGGLLARSEGFRVLGKVQREMLSGRMPGRALLDGASVLVGGALLLTPGILTDVLGFSLLLPPSRRWLQDRLLRRLRKGVEQGDVHVTILRSRPLDRDEEGPGPPSIP